MTAWVLTPCPRRRLLELTAMLYSLNADPARTVIVTTEPDPIRDTDLQGTVLPALGPDLLFGQWLNYGLDHIASFGDRPHEVLCIGSSMLGTVHSIDALRRGLRTEDLTMCGPDLFGRLAGQDVERHRTDTRTLYNRVPGICFMLPGELGLRFDPEFRWWYGEDDLEMQARALGDVGLVGGTGVRPTCPDGHPLNEQQAAWAVEDRGKFLTKWGREPW